MSHIWDIRLVDLLAGAVKAKASDIHVAPGARAAIRVDGTIHRHGSHIFGEAEVRKIAADLFGSEDITAIESGHDVSKALPRWNDVALRLHGYRASTGVAFAIRLLPARIPDIGELQLPASIEPLTALERGLVLFGGPTGSGKSTTLAAVVGHINRTASARIITVEDPIEYVHESERSFITQREVGRDVRSHADAVLGALRADPDVIVIGEMREPQTFAAALTAAETGHLVLATIHTGSAMQTIDRIIDAFPAVQQAQIRVQLAASVRAVVCQRLVAVRSGEGRRPLVEMLTATDGVRAMIREARTHLLANAMTTGRSAGMQTFEQHRQELLAEGAIAPTAARDLGAA